ncbi:unnamed protein product, partial [Nesidiocoris tenuis]
MVLNLSRVTAETKQVKYQHAAITQKWLYEPLLWAHMTQLRPIHPAPNDHSF